MYRLKANKQRMSGKSGFEGKNKKKRKLQKPSVH